ncbi:MAG: glycosyltransferase family 1 protein [Ignavibacteriae bacterium]|nr:MAG: glycosyltransferase family 1 protein [Ignavibacteriota bacterium]
MKILLLNWQDIKNPAGGGAEVYLHQIFKRIAAQGHSITLFCSQFAGGAKEELIDDIRIVRKGSRSLFNYVVPFEYERIFRREHYDLIIDDLNKIPFYTPLYVREPLLGMVMHLFDKSIFKEASFPAASYVYGAERLAMKIYRNTPLVAISDSTRKELIAHGCRQENIFLVPCAVNHAAYRPLPGVVRTESLIGYVGRIKKYKSVDHLLRAFAIVLKVLPDAKLVIIGDGDGKPAFERLSHELLIDHTVTFTGFLPLEEKVRLLNQMQLVVNTSAKEGWGLTVTEANACGTPAVASDVPGLRDAVKDGETGLLYEYGNIEQLAEKILLLLRDEHLRFRLTAGALEYAQSLTWDKSAAIMLEVIEKVLAKKK